MRRVALGFNSRPSCDGRPFFCPDRPRKKWFQFTPVVRRATRRDGQAHDVHRFNSRPSCDGRPVCKGGRRVIVSFNSRPSCDGRPVNFSLCRLVACFNSRPSCDGRLARDAAACVAGRFNSRPSCDGRPVDVGWRIFQSGFNSRPSCDGRPDKYALISLIHVSIHARRATGDRAAAASASIRMFQFTPVVRRATLYFDSANGILMFQFTPVVRRATRNCKKTNKKP